MPYKQTSIQDQLSMATRSLKEMPMSELVRLSKTQKGRAFLKEEMEMMDAITAQIRAALASPSDDGEPTGRKTKPRRAEAPKFRTREAGSSSFDGATAKLSELIDRYTNDPNSPYHKVLPATRRNYTSLIKRIANDHGSKQLSSLKMSDFDRFYRGWQKSGKLTMANALMTMARMIVTYGAHEFDDDECSRLLGLLLRFKVDTLAARTERLTHDQAKAVIKKAHEMGLASIALAQAFQFDCKFPQKDVLGRWAAIGEPGHSEIIFENEKWLDGLRWNEIDENYVLTRTNARGKKVRVDLQGHTLVMQELLLYRPKPTIGPVIISEVPRRSDKSKRLPWSVNEFRRQWRKVADAAGIPKTIKNMDSRAGAREDGDEETTRASEALRPEARH